MPTLDDLRAWLLEECADPDTGWALGVHGAIAEFFRDDDEPRARAPGGVVEVRTRRGGLRVDVASAPCPIAWERLARAPDAWVQCVSLCLPRPRAEGRARGVLTELGPDEEALEPERRGERLFDLGLGIGHVAACVRTADRALLAVLRRHAGRNLLTSPAAGAIARASPHRVFASRVARIEVYQPIPTGRTPSGPHTHLLPALLRAEADPESAPRVSPGSVSCLDVYPANPLRTALGELRSFDARRHRRFQEALARWGDPDWIRTKERARERLAAGGPAGPVPAGASEAWRVAARQHAVVASAPG